MIDIIVMKEKYKQIALEELTRQDQVYFSHLKKHLQGIGLGEHYHNAMQPKIPVWQQTCTYVLDSLSNIQAFMQSPKTYLLGKQLEQEVEDLFEKQFPHRIENEDGNGGCIPVTGGILSY